MAEINLGHVVGPAGPAPDMSAYRKAVAQDAIDANLMALGLTGAVVGDLARVAAVDANGKPTSWKHVPLCEIKTNPNLLDNWYFVYGKAINNDYSSNGTFPVNQRGNQAYQIGSAVMYTVDRWILAGSSSLTAYSAILGNENGLSNTNANAFYQIIENPQRFAGKTATFSALIKRTVASSASRIGFVVNDSWFGEYSQLPNTPGDETVVSCTVTFDSSVTSIKPWIYDNNGTYQLKAVKLELGSEQTLAHNKGTEANPVWVLNEIPDYDEQLFRCMASKADPNNDTYANKPYSSLWATKWNTSSGGFSWCKMANGMIFAYIKSRFAAGSTKSGLYPNSYYGTGNYNISDIPFTRTDVMAGADLESSFMENLLLRAEVNWNHSSVSWAIFTDNPSTQWAGSIYLIGF